MSTETNKAEWPDPTIVAADSYRALMENDRVRVLDLRVEPGQTAAMHGHPNHVLYVFADCTFKLTLPDGTTQELPLAGGQALWSDATAHAAENVGTAEAHCLAIELKEPQKE